MLKNSAANSLTGKGSEFTPRVSRHVYYPSPTGSVGSASPVQTLAVAYRCLRQGTSLFRDLHRPFMKSQSFLELLREIVVTIAPIKLAGEIQRVTVQPPPHVRDAIPSPVVGCDPEFARSQGDGGRTDAVEMVEQYDRVQREV